MKKIYNVVNSVKGGCGKTTLSVWLATYLNNQAVDLVKGNSCIIDMDLQGTALVSLFYGSNDIDQNYHYLHEWIRGYQIKGTKFIQEICLEQDKKFSVVFASPKQEDKNLFYSGARSNYSPIIEYGTFRLGISRLLKNGDFCAHDFKHIIFDMPPNADGYSDSALECVLNPRYTAVEKDDIVNLFMMMTMDNSHMSATTDWLKELYAESNNSIPDQLFIVFNNNVISVHAEDCVDFCKTKKNTIKDVLDKIQIPESKKDNIYFCVMNRNIGYSSACMNGKGLINYKKEENGDLELGLDNVPFGYFSSYTNSEFVEMKPETFAKLLTGEYDGN